MGTRDRLTPRSRAVVLGAGLAVVVAAVYILVTLRLAQGGAAPSPVIVGGSPLLNAPAPDFVLTDLDGRAVQLRDYRGRPVVVNFWASWCIPCRTEFALFANARRAHAGDGLEILGVIYKDSDSAARAFMTGHDASWPALVDAGGKVATAYGVLGAPTSFYVDRAGIVRAVSFGPPPQSVFDEQLRKIL